MNFIWCLVYFSESSYLGKWSRLEGVESLFNRPRWDLSNEVLFRIESGALSEFDDEQIL